MASTDYSEDNNVQEPIARLFEENLDWRSVYAFNAETFGPDSLLGRKDASQVVLVSELDKALVKLNPKLAASNEGRIKLTLARSVAGCRPDQDLVAAQRGEVETDARRHHTKVPAG